SNVPTTKHSAPLGQVNVSNVPATNIRLRWSRSRTAEIVAEPSSVGRVSRSSQLIIDVLIDREAVRSAGATRGEPWQYYDLVHGDCTYDFIDPRPHRLSANYWPTISL